MFNVHDITRDACMLHGPLRHLGYDWWWHSFTGRDEQTGEEKPFFIEFFVCNPALGGDEPVFGQLPESKEKGIKPSYLMVKAGAWGENHAQLHRFFAWDDVKMHEDAPYSIEADDCLASETDLRGSIHISEEEALAHPEWMCDAGQMRWELTVDKQIAFNVGYGASKALRDIEAFAMYWHAEGMKSAFAGWVEFAGRRYIVTPETSFGYADKNWGRDFTSPWVWLSSNHLTSRRTGERLKNSVFDMMETEITCRKKDMLLVNYEAPDGSKKHNRLWNGGNGKGLIKLYERRGRELELIDEIVATHVGCEYGEYDPQDEESRGQKK